MLNRVARSSTPRGGLHFAVGRGQVGFDDARADDKLFRNLGISETPCHQP